MAKVISAKDWGFRVQVVITHNPTDPEYVHVSADGTTAPHTGEAPAGTPAGTPTGDWCEDCVYNWRTQTFTWTNDELYYLDANAKRVRKTPTMLKEEIAQRIGAPSQTKNLAIVGHTIA
jgi:hypothetical protein